MFRFIGMRCFLWLALFTGTLLHAQSAVEHARLLLLRDAQEEFSSTINSNSNKELLLQLPQYLRAETGSVVRLTLRRLSDPASTSNAIVLAWNDHILATNLIEPADTQISLLVPVPRPAFLRGWNRLSVRVGPPPSDANAQAVRERAAETLRWSMLRHECFLDLVYTRAPLSDDLARFPHSLAEERLLKDVEPGRLTPPGVTLLLPGLCNEVHLRAAAIASARLGQLDSLAASDIRLGSLESWKAETAQHHGILIARRDQLGGVAMPFAISTALANLTAAQGMLAEFFEGPIPKQRRVLLVTGADEAGLEKAALTLGSAPALSNLTSPAVLNQIPALPGSAPASVHAPILGLYQIQEFLKSDPWARRAAFLVPARLGLEVVRELFPLWWDLGRAFPTSPVLWPEVVTYRPGAPLAAERLRARNVLALGTVSQWPDFLPPDAAAPALQMISSEAESLVMQGRRQKRATLEPTLSFVQMLPSPWSPSNTLVLVGGMRTFMSPGAKRLLLDSTVPGRLAGSLCAIDDLGRVTSYDLRQVASESFAERLQRTIPRGAGREETERQMAGQDRRQAGSRQWNGRLSAICAAGLGLLVLARLYLMWQQNRVRRQTLDEEISAGS
ncbi:MAG TPA: cellulose biosynthesis cyclic di-GMP-binding regulatory protein BcsB [Verrucomicrobiae bacterium]|nr:cellulose biosynthesis cyclic di-GMP-binding regulatory protein BcsB [Verrucomicrobiae bacterium]